MPGGAYTDEPVILYNQGLWGNNYIFPPGWLSLPWVDESFDQAQYDIMGSNLLLQLKNGGLITNENLSKMAKPLRMTLAMSGNYTINYVIDGNFRLTASIPFDFSIPFTFGPFRCLGLACITAANYSGYNFLSYGYASPYPGTSDPYVLTETNITTGTTSTFNSDLTAYFQIQIAATRDKQTGKPVVLIYGTGYIGGAYFFLHTGDAENWFRQGASQPYIPELKMNLQSFPYGFLNYIQMEPQALGTMYGMDITMDALNAAQIASTPSDYYFNTDVTSMSFTADD